MIIILKKFKNVFISILFILCILPTNILAYSDYLLVSGKNIGINIKSDGIMVVGLYNIGNVSPGKDANINLGDRIIKINDKQVNNINEMVSLITSLTNKESIKITYIRDNKENTTNLKLVKSSDGTYKTGLYVKDEISGVGTLTFIDPESKKYGALGHEIIDKNTSLKMEIKDGKIFKSEVTSITKSSNGNPGEKNAIFYTEEVFGDIEKNTSSGIFGNYKENISDLKKYEIADSNEIKLGSAKILTVLDGSEVKEYDINITRLNDSKSKYKNILFDITDEELLEKTGGIVQGMSGSPIIQDDKIIGAVTHVVVDNPKKGYGIYITNMLNEMEK